MYISNNKHAIHMYGGRQTKKIAMMNSCYTEPLNLVLKDIHTTKKTLI